MRILLTMLIAALLGTASAAPLFAQSPLPLSALPAAYAHPPFDATSAPTCNHGPNGSTCAGCHRCPHIVGSMAYDIKQGVHRLMQCDLLSGSCQHGRGHCGRAGCRGRHCGRTGCHGGCAGCQGSHGDCHGDGGVGHPVSPGHQGPHGGGIEIVPRPWPPGYEEVAPPVMEGPSSYYHHRGHGYRQLARPIDVPRPIQVDRYGRQAQVAWTVNVERGEVEPVGIMAVASDLAE